MSDPRAERDPPRNDSKPVVLAAPATFATNLAWWSLAALWAVLFFLGTTSFNGFADEQRRQNAEIVQIGQQVAINSQRLSTLEASGTFRQSEIDALNTQVDHLRLLSGSVPGR